MKNYINYIMLMILSVLLFSVMAAADLSADAAALSKELTGTQLFPFCLCNLIF
ncbi:MAG: hypothetical protein AABX04_04995 [Nanoarchaeota archaeon]